MSEILLEINNLTTSFLVGKEEINAIEDIHFSVSRGETVAVVGESGSGKSVTSLSVMRLISGKGRLKSGNIILHEADKQTDLLSLTEKEMQKYRGKKLAMIFQEPMTSLNPVYTCGHQVMEPLRLHLKLKKEQAKKRTLELFEKVKLPDPERMFNSYPHQLSGGQKQRVMIAMAMSCNPDLLIADEPTTALDVTVQKSILELMKELQKETGMGMIFISHDLSVVAGLAHKVLVMKNGRIVEQGSVEQIFKNPVHPYTQGLLACRPSLDVKLKKLPTVSDFMEEKKSDLLFTEKNIVHLKDEKERRSKIYLGAPALEIRNLKVHFPVNKGFFAKPEVVKAVDDVSFDVYKGETLGLVGESGCGKSTLGRAIMRLIDPSSGEIYYNGKNVLGLGKEEVRQLRKKIQIIFQDPYSSLNPRLTIGEAIMEPMKVHKIFASGKERRHKVIELLERVNMSESQFNRYPHEFSGGQRQRISIARAIGLNPEFIICDESVSALDVSVQAQVLNLLNELKTDFNFTYIFISHDMSVVKYMSDRMMIMNKGKIEEIGNPEDVFAAPKSEYTRRLIEAIPR